MIEQLDERAGRRLRSLRLRALADAPDAFGSTLEEAAERPMADWTAQLRDLATFAAVCDGADTGIVRGGPDHDRPDTAWLLSMWVAPEARRRGVGSALIDAVVVWARAQGFSRLALEVGDLNHAAIALYGREGFAPTGAVGSLPAPREHVLEHELALDLRPR